MQLVRGSGWEGNNNCKMSAEWNFFCCGGSGRYMETDHTRTYPVMFRNVWKKRMENTCFNHNLLQILVQAIEIVQCKLEQSKQTLGLHSSFRHGDNLYLNWVNKPKSLPNSKLLCMRISEPDRHRHKWHPSGGAKPGWKCLRGFWDQSQRGREVDFFGTYRLYGITSFNLQVETGSCDHVLVGTS